MPDTTSRMAQDGQNGGAHVQVDELLTQARDTITVKRVFGEPIERDGVTVIPVAKVMGGGGGGSGEGPVGGAAAMETEGATGPGGTLMGGSGGGFGVRATPAGVFVIRGGAVQWVPVIDATRIALMGQVVAILFLLVIRGIVKDRAKA